MARLDFFGARGTRVAQQKNSDGQAGGTVGTDLSTAPTSESLGALWADVAATLRRDLGARTFDHWLRPLRLADWCADTGTVAMTATTRFSANWINDRFAERLLLAWRLHCPAVQRIDVRADSARDDGVRSDTVSPSLPQHTTMPVTATPLATGERPQFDPRQSFDRFVVARSNILAANAARRMAAAETPLFNPLYLQSGTGQGKTHLLHAMAQAFLALRPDARIILLSAEKFMLEFVGAMRANEMMAFKARLRAADMLLIDDLQFVIGKGSTQEELLHTIDDLLGAGKRLVVTADRPPHMLDGVDQRLLSRLSGGLVADIEAADGELRERIVRQRIAGVPGIMIPDDVVAYLVRHFTRNVRELEGALNKLLAYAALTGAAITLALAEDRLAESVRGARPRITIDEIQRAVCAHYRLDKSEMSSKRRVRAIARPRQVAMYLAKELTPRSYPEIGRKFGGRDHSTVIHAVRAVEALRAADSDLDNDIVSIRRALKG
ncbi:MAG: Chromosomal replication initiator protein DnaA [Pseudomonadota bacterium]